MVILDKTSKKVLKKIVSLYMDGEDVTDVLLHEHLSDITIPEIQSSLSYLRGNNLIDYDYIHSDPILLYINKVSYVAGKSKEFQWLEFRHFLYRSIFIPAIVSFLMSLIFYWLTNEKG